MATENKGHGGLKVAVSSRFGQSKCYTRLEVLCRKMRILFLLTRIEGLIYCWFHDVEDHCMETDF